MMIHAVTLPIEFDASFSKALPILREGNYISQNNEKAVSRILNAAALTYVSAALADILNLGRWLVIYIDAPNNGLENLTLIRGAL